MTKAKMACCVFWRCSQPSCKVRPFTPDTVVAIMILPTDATHACFDVGSYFHALPTSKVWHGF
jgi:hypothetical protein